jgi:hypothetical protein
MVVGTTEEANTLDLEGFLHNHKLKNCELFHSECNMTQCFRCYQYSNIAMICQRVQICGNCIKEHSSATYQTTKDLCSYFCSNCKGKHIAWDRTCPVRKTELKKLQLPTQHTLNLTKSPAMPHQLPRIHRSIFTLLQHYLQPTKTNSSPNLEQSANGQGSPLLQLLESRQKTAL